MSRPLNNHVPVAEARSTLGVGRANAVLDLTPARQMLKAVDKNALEENRRDRQLFADGR